MQQPTRVTAEGWAVGLAPVSKVAGANADDESVHQHAKPLSTQFGRRATDTRQILAHSKIKRTLHGRGHARAGNTRPA